MVKRRHHQNLAILVESPELPQTQDAEADPRGQAAKAEARNMEAHRDTMRITPALKRPWQRTTLPRMEVACNINSINHRHR